MRVNMSDSWIKMCKRTLPVHKGIYLKIQSGNKHYKWQVASHHLPACYGIQNQANFIFTKQLPPKAF